MIAQDVSNDILTLAAQEVFETRVFLDLHPVTECHRHWSGDSVLGCITFGGAIEGCFTFSCPTEGATAIAQSMLGLSPTDTLTPREIQDAMGELTNLVMGSLKSLVVGIFGDIQFSIPTVICGQNLEHGLGEKAEVLHLGVTLSDKYPAELSFGWRV